jgi:hypothetical protein
MHMLYNSDNFVVVQFDFPSVEAPVAAADASLHTLARGGYEIVDKSARKEIFLEGALAESFKEGVQALTDASTSVEEIDAYLGRFSAVMQQSVVLH